MIAMSNLEEGGARFRGSTFASEQDETAENALLLHRWNLPPEETAEMDELVDASLSPSMSSTMPLTVKLTDYVRLEQEEEYLEWQHGIRMAMETVVAASSGESGLTKSTLLRETFAPPSKKQMIRYVTIFSLPNRAAAIAWQTSPEYKVWLRKLADLNLPTSMINEPGSSIIEDGNTVTGDFPMFEINSFNNLPAKNSERWRTTFLVWLQVYLVAEFYGLILPLIFNPFWATVPYHIQFAIGTAATTLTMEVATMPLCFKCARAIKLMR